MREKEYENHKRLLENDEKDKKLEYRKVLEMQMS